MTPPPQLPPQALRRRSLPRLRAKDRTRRSLSLLRPSLSPRASHSTTAVSRPFCRQATATQACLTTLECPVPYLVLLPSNMAPPCLFLLEGQDQLRPSSTAWASAWETLRLAPSSSRHSSSPAAMASTPSAQVPKNRCQCLSALAIRAGLLLWFVWQDETRCFLFQGTKSWQQGRREWNTVKGTTPLHRHKPNLLLLAPGKVQRKDTVANLNF